MFSFNSNASTRKSEVNILCTSHTYLSRLKHYNVMFSIYPENFFNILINLRGPCPVIYVLHGTKSSVNHVSHYSVSLDSLLSPYSVSFSFRILFIQFLNLDSQLTQPPALLPSRCPTVPPLVCYRGGLLCSVETPISRTSRPPEGHSQSFGVRTEEGWAGPGAALRVLCLRISAALTPGVISHTFTTLSQQQHQFAYSPVLHCKDAKSGSGLC